MTQLLVGFKEVGNSYMTKTNNHVLPRCLGNKVKISGKLQEICVVFFNLLKLKRKKMVILYRLSKSTKVFQLDIIRTEKIRLHFRSYKCRANFLLVHYFSHVGIHRQIKRKVKINFKCSGWHPMGCHSAQADLRFCLHTTKINFTWQMHLGYVSTQESSWRKERKQQANMSSELEEGSLGLPL